MEITTVEELPRCKHCEGLGMRITVDEKGSRSAETCYCQVEKGRYTALRRAQIPKRYESYTLASYEPSQNLFLACNTARQFAEKYPSETDGSGLIFSGSIGTGKTHLAVGILQELIINKGVRGLFCGYRELLKSITNSYNAQVQITELELLKPVFEAEVLVIDELGAAKVSEWVLDTIEHVLNTRYVDKRTTIITTNYPNLPAGEPEEKRSLLSGYSASAETLGDRIGNRMWSRLQEMCYPIEMRGVDYRTTIKRANFLSIN